MTSRTGADTGTDTRAADDRREAARALLAHPVLTGSAHPDELALVRVHAPALRTMFTNVLGYRLVVESTFARLVKGPVDPAAPPRPARRADGAPFTPGTYTHLALLCASLLAPATGEQVLISALIDQVRADAATIGVPIGDSLPERRQLVTALGTLIDWGVITETDGTAAAWGQHREEALLTVHRALLPHLLTRPLSSLDNADDLLAPDPALAEQPRRSLRRKLVEDPLVRREDLTDAERDALSRERTELTRVLDDSFGLTLEVRAEGALAYDPAGSLSDIAFPGEGTLRQAALLLLDGLGDLLEPEAGATVTLPDGRTVPGLFASWEQVDATLADLVGKHRQAWSSALTDSPEKLRRDVTDLLCALSLGVATDTGLVVHPAAARYRPQPHAAPSTRAARRLAAGDADAPLF